MKVVFLGTPQFAVLPLEAILASTHNVVGVVCQPDRAGARNKTTVGPVKTLALQRGLPVFQYEKISKEGVAEISALQPDIMVTAAYGQMLSQAVLDIAPRGIINIHGSLLPKLRGAAPIQFAIIEGMQTTGITILQTVYKMDAGGILMKESLEIGVNETAGELFTRMSVLGAQMIVPALNLIESGKAQFVPQDENEVTFCKKIIPELEQIDFCKTANEVRNLVRGLNPSPVAWSVLEGKRIKIYQTELVNLTHNAPCGTVIAVSKKSLTVACGGGTALNITELQAENGKRMSITSFLCGNKIDTGMRFWAVK